MLKAMIQLPITLEQLIVTVQQLQPNDPPLYNPGKISILRIAA